MTNTENTDQPLLSEGQEAPELTPGASLAQAREQLGVSLEQMSEALRITRTKLIALENDCYDDLPAETFVLGYVRAYCRFLNLDEHAYIALYKDYRAANQQVEQLIQTQVTGSELPQKNLPVRIWVIPLVLIILVAVLYGVIEREPANSTAPIEPVKARGSVEALPETAGSVEASSEQSAIKPNVSSSQSETLDQDTVGDDVSAKGESQTVDTKAPEPRSAQTQSTQSLMADRLVMVFSDECWLQVSDAKGDVLAADLKQAGDRVELLGKAPFNVMLGNARAVSVTLNERAIKLEPKGNNRTLRLTIE